MEVDRFTKLIECRDRNLAIPIVNEKVLKFRYDNKEYKFLSFKDAPLAIVILIGPKDNKDVLTNVEFITVFKNRIDSLLIPELLRDHPLDLYKSVFIKVDGESGLGTTNFNIIEEDTQVVISVG